MIDRLIAWLIARAQRTPYFHLDGYMERYWLIRPRPWLPFKVRIHHILRSDTDRHLHDHPSWSISIILRGRYVEQVPIRQKQHPTRDDLASFYWRRPAGTVVWRRRADFRHRLIVPDGETVWTVFIMGRKSQEWGFYTPRGKVVWREYLNDYSTQPEQFE